MAARGPQYDVVWTRVCGDIYVCRARSPYVWMCVRGYVSGCVCVVCCVSKCVVFSYVWVCNMCMYMCAYCMHMRDSSNNLYIQYIIRQLEYSTLGAVICSLL